MGLFIYLFISLIFGMWASALANSKGKSSPFLWGICGFIFNVIPIIALSAVLTKEEYIALLRESESKTVISEIDQGDLDK